MCVADDPAVRPTMSSVILMLGSKSISSPPPSTLPYSAARFVSMSDQPSSIGTGTGFLTSDQCITSKSSSIYNFSEENKLEEGGFGPDYKGKITNGKVIAVKRLSMRSRQGLGEFKNEVKLIVKLQHKNLVRLLGYCLKKDEMIIVYKFMANTSLDTFLSEQGILPLPGRSEVLVTYDDPAVRATMSSVILMLKSKSINLPQPSTLPYSAARFVTMSDQSSSIGTGTGFLASDQSITSGSSLLERSKKQRNPIRTLKVPPRQLWILGLGGRSLAQLASVVAISIHDGVLTPAFAAQVAIPNANTCTYIRTLFVVRTPNVVSCATEFDTPAN
ncbi:hypothetical protein F3Y22_tig00117021pilonHSYRG00325 [Hibiscus syriacus]|uniref:Protein kinase domain-containing protein n=1 Tax=Hibiscus syriacus TaxID=106335 RepID=A0A6A2X1H4_HIBSY|nr:hypothetical protein F3Y22_tig00117021pilonHSYRG00325 [Hibiscus syriacus]